MVWRIGARIRPESNHPGHVLRRGPSHRDPESRSQHHSRHGDTRFEELGRAHHRAGWPGRGRKHGSIHCRGYVGKRRLAQSYDLRHLDHPRHTLRFSGHERLDERRSVWPRRIQKQQCPESLLTPRKVSKHTLTAPSVSVQSRRIDIDSNFPVTGGVSIDRRRGARDRYRYTVGPDDYDPQTYRRCSCCLGPGFTPQTRLPGSVSGRNSRESAATLAVSVNPEGAFEILAVGFRHYNLTAQVEGMLDRPQIIHTGRRSFIFS